MKRGKEKERKRSIVIRNRIISDGRSIVRMCKNAGTRGKNVVQG